MYNILDYGAMIADKGRMDPYVMALRDAVAHDSIVMDIGTGTGVFALLACHFGARHVYAIEPNDAIQVGRELAAANGFSEKITFIQALSNKITLPEIYVGLDYHQDSIRVCGRQECFDPIYTTTGA